MRAPTGASRSAGGYTASHVRLRVTVPPGTAADVVLPDGRRTETGPGTSVFEFPTIPPHIPSPE